MKLVVDTSVLIDHLRGGNTWGRLLTKIDGEDIELFIATVAIFELFSGTSSKETSAMLKINKLLKNFQKIELTEKIAMWAGELYRDVDKTLQVPDYIIAASCLSIEGTIVTLNRKHFEQIPHLDLYPV